MSRKQSSLNRREMLQRMSAVGVGAVISACGGGNNDNATATPTSGPNTQTATPIATATPPPTASATATSTRTVTPPAATPTPSPTATVTPTVTPDDIACILSPEQTLGPFFIDVGLARSDIREDRPGVPLRVALQLVDADGCTPIRDAVINIWHADARGAYSGFPNQPGGIDTTGETFLRGFQITDANGRVELITIYPGWYTGRTPHIHVRAHLDASTVLVTQVYFPEDITDAVYAQAPYDARPNRDTTNEEDFIARNDLDELSLTLTPENDGYTGSIVFGVVR